MVSKKKARSRMQWKSSALILFVSAIGSILAVSGAFADDRVSVHVRIFPSEYGLALEELRKADHDVVREDREAGFIDVVVDEAALHDLYQYGSITIIERSRPFREIQQERDAVGGEDAPDARYKTFTEVLAVLDQVQAAHPAIAQVVDLTAMLGTPPTWENRHLYAMKISDNVAKDEDEPVIMFDALHHARELNTIEAALGLINQLTAEYDADPDIKALVDKLEIWVVPVVNPDGLEFVWSNNNLWRKNRRNNGNSFGVDLNRNYPFKWGQCGSTSGSPGSDTYRGPESASEPESQTIMALGQKVRPAIYNSYHSSGREVLWAYRCGTMADAPVIRSIRDAYRNAMRYAQRGPSASGESYEWFYNQISSVAFLTEMDAGDWQPAFPVTEREVERLKPGWTYLLGSLADGRYPLVQGHVTDLSTGAPVEAEISSSLVGFVEGERRASEPLAGRYAWFLEQDKQHELTFSADGYEAASELVVPTVGVTDLEVSLVPMGGGNRPPVSDAGLDQAVDEGMPVVLDGTGSRDLDGSIAGYQWGQVSGPSVVLTGADTASASFTAPAVTAEMVLTLELRVTDDDGATDTDTVSVTVQDTIADGADLMVSALSVTGSPVAAGASLGYDLEALNQGNQSAQRNHVRLVLSRDAVIDGSDQRLTRPSLGVPALAGGASVVRTGQVTIPSTVAPGTYFLGAIVDPAGKVAESDEANNTRAVAVTVTGATPDGPDLVVSALSVTGSPVAPGASLGYDLEALNQGNQSAQRNHVRLVLSPDAVIDGSDRRLTRPSLKVPVLAGGASAPLTGQLTIPSNVAPGPYFLGAIVDPAGKVAETDEANNARAVAVTVSGGPGA